MFLRVDEIFFLTFMAILIVGAMLYYLYTITNNLKKAVIQFIYYIGTLSFCWLVFTRFHLYEILPEYVANILIFLFCLLIFLPFMRIVVIEPFKTIQETWKTKKK